MHRRGTARRLAPAPGGPQRGHGAPPARPRPRRAHEDREGHRARHSRRSPRPDARRAGRFAGREPRLRQLGRAHVPVAGRCGDPGGSSAAPRPRRPRGHAEVQAERRAQHPRARLRARDGGARGRWRALQGIPRRAGRAGSLARDPDRLGARARARAGFDARRLRRGGRVAGALPGRRGRARDGRRDQHAAQGQRVARRGLRGAVLRGRSRARLARLLGGAPRRAPGDGHPLDPGDEGRLDRRRLSDRRACQAHRRTTRSSTRRSAATTARPTAPVAWRAA